ncbi:unnamed protein product [Thlaspi arvense]|uniref:Neprosin PEP catalytic domain-containing protein n=1 Tax=Thlaspi arvense TaxID=13288 RepID=A0AAU9RV25_THLAR|nr:unnamed protein product [Thlaspi arvense]
MKKMVAMMHVNDERPEEKIIRTVANCPAYGGQNFQVNGFSSPQNLPDADSASTPKLGSLDDPGPSPDGDVIECVDRRSQPAFSHPLLKYHKLQETPTEFPGMTKNEDEVIWHRNGTKCPTGTVPIRKVTQINGTSSEAANRFTKEHEYAIGYMKSIPSKIYGTKAKMSVWHPKIQNDSGEFSLGQVWLAYGSYTAGDLNSIEAGWQVYPHIYLDNQPRLFIFWTRDAYRIVRCYNLDCPGFV